MCQKHMFNDLCIFVSESEVSQTNAGGSTLRQVKRSPWPPADATNLRALAPYQRRGKGFRREIQHEFNIISQLEPKYDMLFG